jgi:hypothetical protein
MYHASTMHQLHINYDSSICTNIINYTPHVCANSSTSCLNHVPNMYLNHIPKTYTNITIKSYLTIHHSIHKPNTINPYIKPCATTSLLCSLKLNQQLQQHIPIPSQEINPSSQNIPQTRCAISLINRPQPCCCHDFSATLFLPHFFYHDFSAMIFLRDFSVAFFCRTFFAALFLPRFFCCDFLCRTFYAVIFYVTLFLPHFFLTHFSCHTFLYQ